MDDDIFTQYAAIAAQGMRGYSEMPRKRASKSDLVNVVLDYGAAASTGQDRADQWIAQELDRMRSLAAKRKAGLMETIEKENDLEIAVYGLEHLTTRKKRRAPRVTITDILQ